MDQPRLMLLEDRWFLGITLLLQLFRTKQSHRPMGLDLIFQILIMLQIMDPLPLQLMVDQAKELLIQILVQVLLNKPVAPKLLLRPLRPL